MKEGRHAPPRSTPKGGEGMQAAQGGEGSRTQGATELQRGVGGVIAARADIRLCGCLHSAAGAWEM
eukprot:806840-Prymnesium_polylepis.1